MKHTHQTKKAWSGLTLAKGYPEEFGRLLDLVRSLDFTAEPDYPGYSRILESLRSRLGLKQEHKLDWPVNLINNPPGKLNAKCFCLDN